MLILGLNVTISFTPAPNVVQVFTTLIVVIVVQHCPGPKLAQMGCLVENFARAASGGAHNRLKNAYLSMFTLFFIGG